mmetsp:Transcript_11350/g.20540  ORF Transcript_11350/g.20540 Transcript_11350/m.20540 type:complete len:80 (-) Transcript_11350:671-910(-)
MREKGDFDDREGEATTDEKGQGDAKERLKESVEDWEKQKKRKSPWFGAGGRVKEAGKAKETPNENEKAKKEEEGSSVKH